MYKNLTQFLALQLSWLLLESNNVCFKKNGYTFAIVYSSKCVTIFLNQTLAKFLLSNIYTVIKVAASTHWIHLWEGSIQVYLF